MPSSSSSTATTTGNKNSDPTNADDRESPSMILLQADTYVIRGDVIWKKWDDAPTVRKTSTHGNHDLRDVDGRIDCLLLRPLASLGNARFGVVGRIYHTGRPIPSVGSDCDDGATTSVSLGMNANNCYDACWESASMWDIESIYNIAFMNRGNGETVEYTYRLDERCALGYNPMKQGVCPRFIGWISTYEPDLLFPCNGSEDDDTTTSRRGRRTTDRIPHISPYSFFIDVARGSRPMVAFAACPRSDEFDDSDDDDDAANSNNQSDDHRHGGDRRKDVQRDAEMTGCFCVNVVSQESTWAMNASAVPLGMGLSEFRLAGGGPPPRADDGMCDVDRAIPLPLPVPTVNAPFVPQSPMFMDVKTGKHTIQRAEFRVLSSPYTS